MSRNIPFKVGSLWLRKASGVAFGVSCVTPFIIPMKQANCTTVESSSYNHVWSVSDDSSVAVFRNKNSDTQITMIGTAHTSPRSVMLVKNSINQIKPDSVVVELDKKRIGYIVTTSTTANDVDQSTSTSEGDDNFNSTSNRKLLQLPTTSHTGRKKLSPVDSMGRLLAQVFQSLKSVGFTEGSEFQTAVQAAFAEGASIILGDRDIDVTLRRLAAAVDSTDRDSFIAAMVRISRLVEVAEDGVKATKSVTKSTGTGSAAFESALTDRAVVERIVDIIRTDLPSVYAALIGERDAHLAKSILGCTGRNVVVVVGYAHMAGLKKHLHDGGFNVVVDGDQ